VVLEAMIYVFDVKETIDIAGGNIPVSSLTELKQAGHKVCIVDSNYWLNNILSQFAPHNMSFGLASADVLANLAQDEIIKFYVSGRESEKAVAIKAKWNFMSAGEFMPVPVEPVSVSVEKEPGLEVVDKSRLTVTLLTKNRHAFLGMAISSLLSQTFTKWDLIIIDDSNVDVTQFEEISFLLKLMEMQGHDITVIRNVGGITKGWQRGLEESNTDFGYRMEDDIWLDRNCLDVLYHHIWPSDNVAAVGGLCPNPFGCSQVDPPELDKFPNRLTWTNAGHFGRIVEPSDGQGYLMKTGAVYKVQHLHGLFVYRKSAVEKVGGFFTDSSDIGHRDETHLTLRLYLNGYDLLVVPRAILWHAEATIGGSRGSTGHGKWRRQLQIADETIFQDELQKWIKENPNRSLHIEGHE